MTTEDELVSAANENFVASYRKLVQHSPGGKLRRFGGVFAFFTGRLDGHAVGASIAIRSDRACGVYAVGTLPAARRRGVGTALTWAAVEAGRAWGRDRIVLQSFAMGLSMYEAMGFRTMVPYVVFGSGGGARRAKGDVSARTRP